MYNIFTRTLLGRDSFMKKILLLVTVTIIAVFCITGCGGNSKSTPQGGTTTQTTQQERPKTLQQQGLEDKNATNSQRNALKKAISYAENMHMSKAAVYHQLTSEYGEKFPEADAQWAIEHLSDIDWNKQALIKAKSYQKNMAMSIDSIRDQLVSEHGEQFTPEEAEYAISQLEK